MFRVSVAMLASLCLCWPVCICAGLTVAALLCGCTASPSASSSLVVSVKWQLYGDALFYFFPEGQPSHPHICACSNCEKLTARNLSALGPFDSEVWI